MSLRGPSKTVVVEPLKPPVEEPRPAAPPAKQPRPVTT
jgi:hypothetical protein